MLRSLTLDFPVEGNFDYVFGDFSHPVRFNFSIASDQNDCRNTFDFIKV